MKLLFFIIVIYSIFIVAETVLFITIYRSVNEASKTPIVLPDGSTKPQMQFKNNATKGYYKNKDGFWVDEKGNIATGQ